MKKNSTLLMVGIIGVIAMLSAALVVVPTTMQQASANNGEKNGEKNRKVNGGNGIGSTDFGFEQDQENKCSRSATCTNTATINFGFPV
jgi:hypothetical protein